MLNHFPTHLQEPQPWFHKPGMDPTYNLNHYPAAAEVDVKEPLFEKPLTPSDVGKLNRLVIPKQHAERYFPLGAGDAAGTLLGFEDESGKSWRFRYSYWNSSQSYVLTKGWSRYVKDKRLDAGDVVFFERHRADRQKLFIGWRRRGAAPSSPVHYNAQGYRVASHGGIPPPDFPPRHPGGGPVEEEEKAARVQSASNNNTNQQQPTRLVRLFGVNFECQLENESESSSSALPSSSSRTTSSQTQQAAYHNYFNYMGYPAAAAPSNYHHHHPMDTEYEQQQQQQLG